jgi:hypothetical protein
MRWWTTLLLCAFVIVPAHGASQMQGFWYGNDVQPYLDGQRWQWLIHLREDGTFDVTFRDCKTKGLITESGTWSLEGDLYRTSTTHSTLLSTHKELTYRVDNLNADRMRLRLIPGDISFSGHRVKQDFVFPDCDLMS